ncbi:hypothetical protein [Streptomyces cinnamoneus]|uniref:hypothetical protein n=1 Tax=Streptomyces cinnamoneus TaxID=53446 RepID=UPI0027E4AD21|nr:hypothetical protein [Streptomyces cinnamoneus]
MYLRLDAALARVATAFRGMTARPDESNCECHWGSAEELALLMTPDTELDPDLLYRTWSACDWKDHAAVLRRILPQFTPALVRGDVDVGLLPEEVGRSFARSQWQQWPAQQRDAVREFLCAWWAHTLVDPEPVAPAHSVFVVCAEASADVGSWLSVWEATDHPSADRHLAEAVDLWEYDLLCDELPWSAWDNKDDMCRELARWLVRHAPARLRSRGAPKRLIHRVRLLGLSLADRWADPPAYRF